MMLKHIHVHIFAYGHRLLPTKGMGLTLINGIILPETVTCSGSKTTLIMKGVSNMPEF